MILVKFKYFIQPNLLLIICQRNVSMKIRIWSLIRINWQNMKVCVHVGLAERALVARVEKVENELNGMRLFASKNFGNDVSDSQDFVLQSVILEVA